MKPFILGCLAVVGMLGASAGDAQAVLIDSFSTSSGIPTFDGDGVSTTTVATQSPVPEAIGGVREFLINTSSSGAFANAVVSGGVFNATASNQAGANFAIWWDSDADGAFDLTGGTNFVGTDRDLTNAGQFNAIEIVGSTSALDTVPITLTLYSGGATATASYLVSTAGTTDFQSFTNIMNSTDFTFAGGWIQSDFADVDAIRLTGILDAGETVTLDLTQSLPEPTSLALLGMGACGLMGYNWRRKKKIVVE